MKLTPIEIGRTQCFAGGDAPSFPTRQWSDRRRCSRTPSELPHPWLIVASFVNPHDVTLYGLLANQSGDFEFNVEDAVPHDLFDPVLFQQTLNDNLTTKPSCQASYQASYAIWMQPVMDHEQYSRFYYQLRKNVDEQMMVVYQTLLNSRFRDNTIVIFTSDHGDLLGSHADMHQKWSTAHEEAMHVPMIFSKVEDVALLETGPRPDQDGTYTVPCSLTVKHTPLANQCEMYNASDDPMELTNLYGNPNYTEQQSTLAALLQQQCSEKRLQPSSGTVPGQPSWDA